MSTLDSLVGALKSLVGPPPDKKEMIANMDLNDQGSIMGSEKTNRREFQRKSPVLSTVQDAIDLLNPVEWMGGPATGATAAFAPIRTAAQKKIAKAAYRVAPELVEEAASIPKRIALDVMRRGADAQSVPSGTYHGRTGTLTIDPDAMRGLVPQSDLARAFADALAQMSGQKASTLAKTGKASSTGNLPVTAAHELQHAVNDAENLKRIMGSGKYQGPSDVIRPIYDNPNFSQAGRAQVKTDWQAGNSVAAMDEALAYLREASIAFPDDPGVKALTNEFLKTGFKRQPGSYLKAGF